MESLTLGPVLFAAPYALIFLLGLPLLWFVLRATPPQPRTADLPSLALFEDLAHREETPDKTPWWIILLRLLAITLAILGLSRPIWSPPAQTPDDLRGDILLVIDNGWTSAPDWSARQSAALNLLSSVDPDQGVYLLPTGIATPDRALKSRLSVQDAQARVRALSPVGWRPDYAALNRSVEEAGLETSETLWISDAVKQTGQTDFTKSLVGLGKVSVVPVTASRLVTISSLSTSADGPVVSLLRADNGEPAPVSVTAFDENGRSVGSASGQFERRQSSLDLTLDLPEDIQSRIAFFRVMGQASAGGVWYWQGASRTRRVGLISGSESIQPLLTDTYYVKKALAPFSMIFEDDLDTLLAEDIGSVILTDVGRLSDDNLSRLTDWVNDGGVLIRFAGPRMAAQTDTLLPVSLRRASRAFDSALSWETPQKLTAFPENSPFYLTPLTSDVHVRRQVLAQPSPELSAKTWARLEDGTPLVTSDRLGAGRLVLFHVTSGPEWSDLPLSGTFVELLRRVTLPARELSTSNLAAETSLAPKFWLDGYGSVISPPPDARPIEPDTLITLEPNAEHPAGVYEGSSVSLPVNAGSSFLPELISEWPEGVTVTSAADRSGQNLGGLLLVLALLLLLVDLIVSLILAGKLDVLRKIRQVSPALLAACLSAGTLIGFPDVSEAQDTGPKAALSMRFGYIETGNAELDLKSEQGLRGLSLTLFRRTTVEPALPDAINLETSPLDLYPLLFLPMPDNGLILSDIARDRLGKYLRTGGALIIDTRAGGNVQAGSSVDSRLVKLMEGLDLPALKRVTEDHVLTRSFYLLDGFTGRYPNRPLWIEGSAADQSDTRRGDGISSIFITDADLAAAWAVNDRNRPLYSVEGGERNREMAHRTGVNLVMYILTGNYKDDQVHIPSLLERMGDVTDRMNPFEPSTPPIDLRPRDLMTPDREGEE